MTALFQCTIDAHQDCLDLRASLASVGVTVLAYDHCRTDCTLGKIILEWNPRLSRNVNKWLR